jgi:hypothetical protein
MSDRGDRESGCNGNLSRAPGVVSIGGENEMRPAIDLLKEARQARDVAARTQKLAETQLDPAGKARIQAHADGLQRQAARLEEEAAKMNRPTIF